MLQIASIVRNEKSGFTISNLRAKRKIGHLKGVEIENNNDVLKLGNICVRSGLYLRSNLNINKMENPHLYVNCGSGHLSLTASRCQITIRPIYFNSNRKSNIKLNILLLLEINTGRNDYISSRSRCKTYNL